MLNFALYGALRLTAWLLRFVPLDMMYACADAAGIAAYFIVHTARRGILHNLEVAFPEHSARDLRRIARAAFRNDSRNWVDTLRIPVVPRDDILRIVPIEGRRHLEAAMCLGRGVVCVTMHLGNYDLVGQALQVLGYRLTIPVERMQPPRLFDFLVGRRASQGINIVAVERAPREMLKALKRGELAGVAGDRDVTGHGVLMDFFGRPALVPTGPAVLARHTGAPVLITVGVRTREGGYRGYISSPVEMQRTEDTVADESENTAKILLILEDFIRRFPDQWLAFSPIWREHMTVSDPATMRQQNKAAV